MRCPSFPRRGLSCGSKVGPLLLIGCAITEPEEMPRPQANLRLAEAQSLANELRSAGYTGAFAVVTATPIVGGQSGVPVRTVMLSAVPDDLTAPAASAIEQLLMSIAEATHADAADPANNTLPSGLGVQIVPSILNRANGQSRVHFNLQFVDFRPGSDSVYFVPGGEVLEHRMLARVRAAGHYHGDSLPERTLARRVGTLQLSSTTFTGSLPAEWLVPEVAGEVTREFRVRQIGGPRDGAVSWFFSQRPDAVRLNGLVRLPPDDNLYLRVGLTTTHPSGFSHWGQPELILAIVQAAARYHVITGRRTSVNDMSLFYGGKFDIWRVIGSNLVAECRNNEPENCWGGPGGPRIAHAEHRHGTEVDINPLGATSPVERQHFRNALEEAFANVEWHGNHFHVRTASSVYLRAP